MSKNTAHQLGGNAELTRLIQLHIVTFAQGQAVPQREPDLGPRAGGRVAGHPAWELGRRCAAAVRGGESRTTCRLVILWANPQASAERTAAPAAAGQP
ncbi:hypothetical protein GCM10017577_04740 [Pseudonocardia halophobica]|uniref:Uncharacterized protein n=1 Tax=Pseudonocardia halophobica TaxID=29401 RepID=A0A9W6KZA9_9PSEU|nr:hypothetical protein GCM10017577_04740 [Pseudonocardia halophobica]